MLGLVHRTTRDRSCDDAQLRLRGILSTRDCAQQVLSGQNKSRNANALDPAQKLACLQRVSKHVENARIDQPLRRRRIRRITDQDRGGVHVQRAQSFDHLKSRESRNCHDETKLPGLVAFAQNSSTERDVQTVSPANSSIDRTSASAARSRAIKQMLWVIGCVSMLERLVADCGALYALRT
jgi:hypothetical protein